MAPTPNTQYRSPNHDGRDGEKPDMIVLHYTGMQTGAEALARLCDPAAKVSAHYLVEEDGQVFALVEEAERAWHAGLSHWQGRDNVNGCSIGIEIVNPGHWWGYRDFPGIQTDAVIALVADIRTRHRVPLSRVVGHSDVAPMRKEDPGERFAWARLARAGHALAPYDPDRDGRPGDPDFDACQALLRRIGYGFPDNAPGAAVLAFQRRFLPARLGRGLDPQTRAAIAFIAAEAGSR